MLLEKLHVTSARVFIGRGIGRSTPRSRAVSIAIVVAGVGVAHDAGAGIGRQHPLEPPVARVGAVGHHHHAGVDRVADADAAAVVQRDPARPAGGVEQRVQQRPVGDGVGAVLHRLGLAVGRGHRAGVEVVPADHDRRRHLALLHQPVEPQPHLGPLAVLQPADPRRQPLELHLAPAPARIQRASGSFFGKGLEHRAGRSRRCRRDRRRARPSGTARRRGRTAGG